jgi:putative addiction module component (TIGR02574 family)
MTKREALESEAMKLPPEERAQLADVLLASLEDEQRVKIENAWIEECDRRWLAIQRGEMGTVDGDEVLRKLEAGEKP